MRRPAAISLGVLALVAGLAMLLGNPRSGRAAGDLGGAALFAAVSPSVAYITTPSSGGSAVLFDAGYLLTNVHVVGLEERVHVRFPDGTTLPAAPVVARDWVSDLAVIEVGPIASARPVTIADSDSLAVGSDVYLVGYPGESEERPSPTISRGVVSKFRTGGPAKLRYIQTDARASGGVSGGAMVAPDGAVVGIVELRRAGGFALAIPAAPAVDRLRALLRGEDIDGLGDRRPSALAAREPLTSDTFTLPDAVEERAYILRPVADGRVVLSVNSTGARLSVTRIGDGDSVFGVARGNERVAQFTARMQDAYIVRVWQNAEQVSRFTITSSQPLQLLSDPDDRRVVRPGERVAGNIDLPGDFDWMFIDLREGQTITVTVTSVAIDANVAVGTANEPPEQDDDSAGGLLESDARVTITADRTGRYIIGISDGTRVGVGGYAMTVHLSAPPPFAPGAGRITSGALASSATRVIVFGGGSSDDLVYASGCGRTDVRFWATGADGQFIVYIPAAIESVNEAWEGLFPFGVPAGTSLLAACDGPASTPGRPARPARTPSPRPSPTATPGAAPSATATPRATATATARP